MAAYERRTYKGNVAYTVTLASDIGGTDLSISLSDGSTFPDGSAGPFTITIDPNGSGEEKVQIESRSGNTLTVPTGGRGYDGTSGASHSSGVKVVHSLSAVDLNEANQLVHALLTGGTTGQVVTVDTTLTPPVKLAAAPSAPVSSVFTRTGAVVAGSGDYTAAQVTNAADKSSASQQAFTGEVKAPDLAVSGLTGAVNPARIVGATNGAAPASGTFAVGDVVVDITGGFYVCTTAGTPGTWTGKIGAATSGATHSGSVTNVALAQSGTTKVFDTASLAVGTWLVTMTCHIENSGSNAASVVPLVDTATASFSGVTASKQAQGSGTGAGRTDLVWSFFATVTVAGTLQLQATGGNLSGGYTAYVAGYTAWQVA